MDPSRIETCSSPVGQFKCGECGAKFETSCGMHVHMTTNHSDGSYHYDNLIKTTFPKYDTCCATTQTSKSDKLFLKQYRRSRTGNPPKRVDGIELETQIKDTYIVMQADTAALPTTEPNTTMNKNNLKRRSSSLMHTSYNRALSYNMCRVSKNTMFNENQCYVALEQFDMSKAVIPPHTNQNSNLPMLNITSEPDNEHGDSIATDASVKPVESNQLFRANEQPFDNNTVHSTDFSDDNGDDVSDRSSDYCEEANNVLPTESEYVFHSNLTSANRSSPLTDNVDAATINSLATPNSKPRMCNNIAQQINYGISDEYDDEWSPDVKKQKTIRKRKKPVPPDNIASVDDSAINNTLPVVRTAPTEPDTNVQRNRNGRNKQKKDHKRYMCDTCGDVMLPSRKEGHLNRHLGVKPYICEVCANSFISEQRLKLHILSHKAEKGIGKYKCEVCGRVFLSQSAYDAHVNMHSGSRPFKCGQCGKAFAAKCYVKQHIGKVHTVKKPIPCKICGREYLKRSSMDYHVETAHSEPKFACRFCKRMFHFHKVKHHHELTHIGEKSFVCTVCGHGFIQRTAYLAHMAKQHGFTTTNAMAMETQRQSTIPV